MPKLSAKEEWDRDKWVLYLSTIGYERKGSSPEMYEYLAHTVTLRDAKRDHNVTMRGVAWLAERYGQVSLNFEGKREWLLVNYLHTYERDTLAQAVRDAVVDKDRWKYESL